ncbi:hypothetical protein LLH03_18305 [bacterium]|nr:hypothetical protein [bacterium]
MRYLVAAIAFVFVFSCTAAMAAKIVVEGEHCLGTTKSMKVMSDPAASGGKCIGVAVRRPHATTETGPADDGHATFKISVPAPGTYQFWGRCWWWDACGNSFFAMADKTSVTSSTPYITDQLFRKWHWVAGPTLTLSKGTHQIRVQYREDGSELDQFILTTTPKSRWQPSRIETETPQYLVR